MFGYNLMHDKKYTNKHNYHLSKKKKINKIKLTKYYIPEKAKHIKKQYYF